jgi:hypothetical protein
MGRVLFEDIVRYCRTDAGFTVLDDVTTKKQGDLMPSYFLAETLKYFYLLFSPDDVVGLETTVFTTEAHPLRPAMQRVRSRPRPATAAGYR